MKIPPTGKKVAPYLARADELDSRYPFVSYYCRLFAIEMLMSMRSNAEYDTALDSVIMELLAKCEGIKSALSDQIEDGPVQMEEFCLSVFANADKADRESEIQPPDIALASRFYISALFFDVLTQFHSGGQLPPDLEQKRKYAKYRTMQIRNRQPLEIVADPITITGLIVHPPRMIDPEPTRPAPSVSKNPVATSSFQYADDSESPRSTKEKTSSPLSIDTNSAKKKLQQAISAIDFGDYATAAALSLDAARMLGRN